MRLEITKDRTNPVAVLRVRGGFNLAQWSAAVAATALQTRGPVPPRIVIDRRRVPLRDSANFAWMMASVAGDYGELVGARWAVLVHGPVGGFEVARIFTSALRFQGFEAAVFRDSESAVTWLLDGDDIVEDPDPPVERTGRRWLAAARRIGRTMRRLVAGAPRR